MAFDFKKEYKELYQPGKEPRTVTVIRHPIKRKQGC